MGKKFIILQGPSQKYRLYSDDIKIIFRKLIQKLPSIPAFEINGKT